MGRGSFEAEHLCGGCRDLDDGIDRRGRRRDHERPARRERPPGGRRAQFGQSQGDPHDVAVVVLDKAVRGITPAELPGAGSLTNLSGDRQFTSVGYGAQASPTAPAARRSITRTYASSRSARSTRSPATTRGCGSHRTSRPATAGPVTATRAARTSSAPAPARRASSPRRRSQATRRAARRMSITAWTARLRRRFSRSS
jgi:hypothetical protein